MEATWLGGDSLQDCFSTKFWIHGSTESHFDHHSRDLSAPEMCTYMFANPTELFGHKDAFPLKSRVPILVQEMSPLKTSLNNFLTKAVIQWSHARPL